MRVERHSLLNSHDAYIFHTRQSYVFWRPSSFFITQHRESHTWKKPYNCNDVGKAFLYLIPTFLHRSSLLFCYKTLYVYGMWEGLQFLKLSVIEWFYSLTYVRNEGPPSLDPQPLQCKGKLTFFFMFYICFTYYIFLSLCKGEFIFLTDM